MKFSEIVKTKDSGLAVAKPAAPPPKTLPAKSVPQQNQSEQEHQAKLEKEFREKLAQIESENKRLTEEQKKQEQSQQSLRDKILQEEQQKLQDLMKDLQKSREDVNAMRLALENEMKSKLESEKARLEIERRNEQVVFQKKIAEIEERLKKNEQPGSLEPKEIPEPKVPPVSQAPQTDHPAVLALPEKPEHISKYLPPRPKSPLSFKTTLVTETDTYQENPEGEAEVREIYFDIVKHAGDIFQQIQKHEKFDLKKIQEGLSSLVSIALEGDSELIRIALEPYPEKNYFPYHAANSAILAVVLGLDFKLSKDRLSNLALAGVLHDIGLVSVQENLDYPKELSEEVKQEVIQHPLKGSEMLAGYVIPEVQTAIAQHHEACNGKGYPQALDEQNICLEAKILQVVDAFEAMTHQRAYRAKPLEVNQAVKEIIEKGRVFYDREVMKALMGRIGLYPVNTMVTLSSKQVARVLRQNPKFPMSPVIRVEFDEFGNKLKVPFVIDLVKNQLIHVIDPITSVPSYSHTRMHRHRKPDVKDAKAILSEVLPYALIIVIGGLLVYLVLKI